MEEDSKEDIRQKRMLLNYILSRIFSNEDLPEQLQQVIEPKKEELPPVEEHSPAPAPRFKALMEKMAQRTESEKGSIDATGREG